MSAATTIATCLILSLVALHPIQGALVFHFTLDFVVKQPNNASEPINQTIILENNQVTMPGDELETSTASTFLGTEEHKFNEKALELLVATKRSVQQLNQELAPLVGRSNDLAVRLKQTMRYVNDVDDTLESGNFGDRIELLRTFLILVDRLQAPSQAAGIRTLEYVLLKLAVEKYELPTRYREVQQHLQQAEAAWATFRAKQVVLSES